MGPLIYVGHYHEIHELSNNGDAVWQASMVGRRGSEWTVSVLGGFPLGPHRYACPHCPSSSGGQSDEETDPGQYELRRPGHGSSDRKVPSPHALLGGYNSVALLISIVALHP